MARRYGEQQLLAMVRLAPGGEVMCAPHCIFPE
jgi:hypothetical protein